MWDLGAATAHSAAHNLHRVKVHSTKGPQDAKMSDATATAAAAAKKAKRADAAPPDSEKNDSDSDSSSSDSSQVHRHCYHQHRHDDAVLNFLCREKIAMLMRIPTLLIMRTRCLTECKNKERRWRGLFVFDIFFCWCKSLCVPRQSDFCRNVLYSILSDLLLTSSQYLQ